MRLIRLAFILLIGLSSANAADDPTVTRLLDEGASHLIKDNADAALKTFSQILLLNPDHPEAHYRLGQVFLKKGDAEKGLEYLRKATKLDPLNARYSLNLGSALEAQGQQEKALAEYQRLVDTGTFDKRAKEAEKRLSLASGQALARKGEYNAALLIFNGLLIDYPNDPFVLTNIGALYVFLNRPQEAESTFTKLLSVDPGNVLAHVNLANIYERTERPEDAMRHYKILVDMKPNDEVYKMAKLRHGIIYGRELLKRKDWANATRVYQEVINLDPTSPEAFFNIAISNLALGNHEQAEKGFLGVLKVTPDNMSARLNLGGLYYDRGQLDKATEQFKYVIDNDKDGKFKREAAGRMNVIHTASADNLLQQGKVEESLREYKKALDFYSGNVKASFTRGLIFIQQRNYDAARAEFESVVRFDPNNMRGRLNLANIYESLNQPTKAAEQYEIMMQINKDSEEGRIASAKWRITKARGLWAEQKLVAAETMFTEIVEEQPDNLEALGYLGIIQQSRGKPEEAAGAFQRILALRPGNQRVRVMLAKVYEQLGLDSLAANEYQMVLFNGASQDVMQEANQRLGFVESRLNGFSNSLSYSINYDSNIAMNTELASSEWRTDLALSVIYGHKLMDDLTYRLIWSPTYSSYHVSQSDYLVSVLQGNIIRGTPDSNWAINFGRQDQQSVVADQNVSAATTISASQNRKLFLPAAFNLAPVGFEGDKIPTQLSMSVSYRGINSATTDLGSATGGIGINLSQGLTYGINASAGYNLAIFRNLDNIVQRDTNVTQVRDPVTGRVEEIPGDLITYDSKDFEYNAHVFSVSLARSLAPGLRGILNLSGTVTDYVNPDSGARAKNETTTRRNFTGAVTVNLGYSFFKDINFFLMGSLQKSYTNLPVGVSAATQDENVENAISSFQSLSLGGFTRWSVSSGMNMSF